MKTSYKLLLCFLFVCPIVSLAQQKGATQKATPQSSSTDCFKEWYTVFQDRGGKTVPDGTHDAVLTLRNPSAGTSKCFMGRIEVVDGKIKPPIMVEKEDGTYDTFRAMAGVGLDPEFEKSMSADALMSIHDGMSINFNMANMEYARIFFYKFINDKPKGRKAAPPPKALIKN